MRIPFKDVVTFSLALGLALVLGSAPALAEETAAPPPGQEEELSPVCAKFAKDPDADLAEVNKAGCTPTLAQMSRLMDNPLGNVAMWINQLDVYRKEDPISKREDNMINYMGIVQFPKGISKNWNVINRIIYNIPSLPLDQSAIDDAMATGPGDMLPAPSSMLPLDLFPGSTTGFGDLYYVGLAAPKKAMDAGNGKFLWGAGISAGFPTATEDILGAGKYTMGPSALAVYMGKKWKVGMLATNYLSYAGDDSRNDVTLSNFQYFVYYSLNDTTSIGAGPNILADWEQRGIDNKWTVPVGIGLSKTVNFGKMPVRLGAEVHYAAIRPEDIVGTKWDFRFYIIPAVPSYMFGWMQ
jgi:hypothetical protein